MKDNDGDDDVEGNENGNDEIQFYSVDSFSKMLTYVNGDVDVRTEMVTSYFRTWRFTKASCLIGNDDANEGQL